MHDADCVRQISHALLDSFVLVETVEYLVEFQSDMLGSFGMCPGYGLPQDSLTAERRNGT